MDKTLTPEQAVASLLASEAQPEKPEEVEEPEEQEETPETEEETPDGESETDPEEGDEPEEPEEAEPFYAVNVDGQELKVPLKDLITGYKRGHNYEQKAEKLREERQAAERERAEIGQRRQEYDQRLSALEAILSQEDPDLKELKDKDPARYLIVRQEREDALRKVTAERGRLAEQQQREQQDAMRRHIAAETQKLEAAIPAWQDPKRKVSEQQAITAYAKGLGYTNEMLAGLVNARDLLVLRKAWLFDQGKGLKGKQAPKGTKTIPAGKPQTKAELTGRTEQKALNRLRQTGRTEDAVSVLLARNR